MEHLPPIGWADVATKADIDNLRVATKADIENLRVTIENLRLTTSTDIDNLRLTTSNDIANLRLTTSTDIENLRVATQADFASLGDKVDRSAAEIRAEIAIQLKESQRWTVTAMLGSTALLSTVLGVMIAVT